MNKLKVNTGIWFVFVVASFWLLGQFSISVGDDLGYMFTDSALHKGDGKLITSIWECFTTQTKHYFSTNGRFLVHTTTHFFTAIAGMKVFNVVNAFVFGLLWLLVSKAISPGVKERKFFAYLLSLFLLWTCVPAPGATLLSLVAFAMNYVWTAVAYLAFLLVLKKVNAASKTFRRNYLLYALCAVGSIVVGSLQESYGLPISAALFILAVFNLKKLKSLTLTMILSFFAGCAACVFAPGNWCHAEQGGGFSLESIMRKSELLSYELMFSVISLLLVIMIVLFIVNRKEAKNIIKQNAFYFVAIGVSLLLAILTFTSTRQLFCPSVFAIIVMGRILLRWEDVVVYRRVLSVAMSVALIGIIVGGYFLRKNTYAIYNEVVGQLGGKSRVLTADVSNANFNSDNAFLRWFAEVYAPDPFANTKLHLVFDGNTKRGLSRMGWENQKKTNVSNVLPYSKTNIEKRFDGSSKARPIGKTTKLKVATVQLDKKYKTARIYKSYTKADKYMAFKTEDKSDALSCVKYIHNGYVYLILDHNAPDSVVLIR